MAGAIIIPMYVGTNKKQEVRIVVIFCPTSNPTHLHKVWTLNSQNVCFYVRELGPLYCGISLFDSFITLSNLQYTYLYSSIISFFRSRKRNSSLKWATILNSWKISWYEQEPAFPFHCLQICSLLWTAVLDSFSHTFLQSQTIMAMNGAINKPATLAAGLQISLYLRMWRVWNFAASAVHKERLILIKTHQPQEWHTR
jgi:hypothetical protein